MKTRRLCAVTLCLTLLGSPAPSLGWVGGQQAAPPSAPAEIAGDDQVDSYRLVRLVAKGDFDSVIWDVEPSEAADVGMESGAQFLFTGPPGRYVVKLITIKAGVLGKARKVVTIKGSVPPVPPGPGPGPGPDPPPPVPPDPAPIPTAGLRVLIKYNAATLPILSPAQVAILYSQDVRSYLQAHAAIGADGKTREYRVWDAKVDASNESKVWQDAMKRPHASLPWILVSNGKAGYEGPLPASIDETMALLKKYGESSTDAR